MGDAQTQHETFMAKALALAELGAGAVAPNPLVGCVLVNDGRIVGRGWHAVCGGDHAEVAALKDAGDAAKGAIAYVTLEPCNHTGRTGPCTEALIQAGVAEVIYALPDPNPVAAGGADALQAAGIKIQGGVCEVEAREQNRAWLHGLKYQRPYVIGKSAMSLDGRIATANGESKWITSEASRNRAHKIRASVDAIIVGADTVVADDPALTARTSDNTRTPLRVVLDSSGRTTPGAKVYERNGSDGETPALLVITKACGSLRRASYEEMGVEILTLTADPNGRPDLIELLSELYGRGLRSIMVEGGGKVLGAFFDAGLIDEFALFIAPKLIGGGKSAFGGEGVKSLSDMDQYEFQQAGFLEQDAHIRGFRKQEGA